MLDLTSAENVMKMQQCLSDLTADVSADMIENMVGELFTERQKQVVELNGEVDDAVDGIDGSRPVVINPPPGLGLLTFRSIKSGYIHQFEVWCINAEAAKFMGMLILNKGRHDRIMKLHYVAHPIMNGIVMIMVETDDQFFFGSKFVEGCGQVQMLNPAEKYMENVIGTGGTQEWRTKCWNAIDCIKETQYSNPTMDNVTRRSFSEAIPGLGKFGNLLTMDKEVVHGSIVCGENNNETKQQIAVFIKSMNYLLSMEDVMDGPPPLEEMPPLEDMEGDEAVGNASEPREQAKEVPTIDELMKNDETFFFDDDLSCDEVFLLPNPHSTSTPKKRARMDADDDDQRLKVSTKLVHDEKKDRDNDEEVKEGPSADTLDLIDEIQPHYKTGNGKEPTTPGIVFELKEMGDDLEAMKNESLNKRCELWGFFQKTQGDLEDYIKQIGELPEHLMKNEIFYQQWKGKKMIDIIFNHYDNEYPNSSGKFTESFVLKEYGEYLMAREKLKINEEHLIANEKFKMNKD